MTKINWAADLERVEFIMAAALERRKALLNGDRARLREDLFQDINDPVLGYVPIGRSAIAKLEELSVSAIAFANLSGRIAVSTARKAFGPRLLQLIIHERQPISRASLQRAFELTEVEIRKTLKTRTHLLPCHIADGKEPKSICIGPVTFLNRSAARQLVRDTVRQHITGNREWDDTDRRMIVQALRYYRGYQWTAMVTIDDCDPKLAAEYARSTITLALSGLQLFLGAKASQSMAVGGETWGWARSAELKIDPSGAPDVTVTTSYRGGASFEAGWSADLDEPGMKLGLTLLGTALEANLPGVHRPLSARYLGSLQWYGEAVRDKSPATRLIKFITAIEHLLLTKEREGVTRILKQRVAALTYNIGSLESRLTVEAKFGRLYDLRSRYVHGSLAPWDERAGLQLLAAAQLAEEVLHSALNCWREEGLFSPTATSKRLRQWFEAIVQKMVNDTEPVEHVLRWRENQARRHQTGAIET